MLIKSCKIVGNLGIGVVMQDLSFGIIIPIYNVEKYLAQCLESTIKQSYQNLQIVCIDDGSTDESFKIAYEYFLKDRRVSLIRKTNGGLSQARNCGLDYLMSQNHFKNQTCDLPLMSVLDSAPPPSYVAGDYQVYCHGLPFCPDYIHFLDSDDYLELDCIEECARFLTQYPQIEILWHDYYLFDERKKLYQRVRHIPFQDKLNSAITLEEMLLSMRTKHFNFGWHGTFRSYLLSNLRFIEGIEYEDVSFAFMLFVNASWVGILDKQLLCYRIREGSICNPFKQDSYPAYMSDLKGIFKKFNQAKFYNFFYSDCLNILKVDSYLTHFEEEKTSAVAYLRKLLRWRVLWHLSVKKHRIKKDPRNALVLYQEIERRGYKISLFEMMSCRILNLVINILNPIRKLVFLLRSKLKR